jgi:phosphate starvation-inducible PhoH-like protein
MIEFGQMRKFMEMDIIEVIPLAFMRGRTLNEAIVICDEAQNTSRSQMLMFLTRLGRGSKMIITGDITQTDLPSGERSGLVEAIAPLANIPGIGLVELEKADIVRHKLVHGLFRPTTKRNNASRKRSIDEHAV